MAIPNELSETLNVYSACRAYKDHGVVTRRSNSSVLLERSSKFSTDFRGDKAMVFSGHSRGSVEPMDIDEASTSGSFETVGHWLFSFDYKVAKFGSASTEKQIIEKLDSWDAGMEFAKVVSLNCSELLPDFLINGFSGNFWHKLMDCTFTVEKLEDDLSIKGKDTKSSDELELRIDGAGLIRHVHQRQIVAVFPASLRALQKAIEQFEEVNSEAALKTRRTIEMLSIEAPTQIIETTTHYRSVVLEKP